MTKKLIFFGLVFLSMSSLAKIYDVSLNTSKPLKTDCIRCLYHGKCFNFANQHCVFCDDAIHPFIVLIITPDIEFKENKHFIYPVLKASQPCIWYNMTLSDSNLWEVVKLAKDDTPARIPNNAIVVLLPPDLVDDVGPEAAQGKKIVHLPIIKLKKNVTQKVLDDVLNHCALETLDINRFCTRPSKRQTLCNNTVVCMQDL
jgi:hypothetical protein